MIKKLVEKNYNLKLVGERREILSMKLVVTGCGNRLECIFLGN